MVNWHFVWGCWYFGLAAGLRCHLRSPLTQTPRLFLQTDLCQAWGSSVRPEQQHEGSDSWSNPLWFYLQGSIRPAGKTEWTPCSWQTLHTPRLSRSCVRIQNSFIYAQIWSSETTRVTNYLSYKNEKSNRIRRCTSLMHARLSGAAVMSACSPQLESLGAKKTEITRNFTRPNYDCAWVYASTFWVNYGIQSLEATWGRKPTRKPTAPPNSEPGLRSGWPGSGSLSGASVRGAAGTECAYSPQTNRHNQGLKPPQKPPGNQQIVQEKFPTETEMTAPAK